MGAAELLPAFGASDIAVRIFVTCAALGLPIAAGLAWAFNINIVRDPHDDAGIGEFDGSPLNKTVVLPHGSKPNIEVHWKEERGRCKKLFRNDFMLGRGTDCEIRFDDPAISRRHAKVTFSDGHWWIADLGSVNGTLLDGKLINKAMLPVQCEVQLSDSTPLLRFELETLENQTILSTNNSPQDSLTKNESQN